VVKETAMATEHAALSPSLLAFLAILTMAHLASCSFQPGAAPPFGCSDFENIPITPLIAQSSQTVFETPGTIIAIHGFGGAKLDSGQSAIAIKVEQSVAIPAYANRATVFLNGWKLNYLGGDQHMLVLSTVIGKIRVDVRTHTLTWDALGLLRDDDGKEGYNWTYQFTIVAWNSANLDAVVDQGVVDANNQYCTASGAISDNYFYADSTATNPVSGTNTALSSFFSFIQNSAFASSKTVAVLPRGFAFAWNDSDHHLRQLSYHMNHSEIVADHEQTYSEKSFQMKAPLPNPPASHADSGFVSWNSDAILKDNDTRRDYTFAEVVSGMGGSDVGVLQPPYSILPADDGSWGCAGLSTTGVASEDYVIENIPFEFAIPMLTGWDLEYACSDQHVKEIGMYIRQWSYQPPAGGTGGTLRYTLSSILEDDDGFPPYFHSHKVTVLGLRPLSGGKVVKGIPTAPAPTRKQ
jgi:hypothetical protein